MIKLCAFSDEAASDIGGQIKALNENGITLTEIRSVNGKNVSDFSDEEAKNYASALKENGISVWSIGSPLGKTDIKTTDFGEYLKKVRRVCELAGIFGTDKIRMFSFFNAYDAREEVLFRLSEMVKTAEEYGVYLYHENEKEIYGDNVARVLDILDNVKGLRSVYDPANFIQVGEDATVSLDALHKRADYFHIKDVIKATGELVPAGPGDGRIDELLNRIDKDVVLTVEPHLAIFDAYKQIDGTSLKGKFVYKDNREAFDAAVNAIKGLIKSAGYAETGVGMFVK